MPPRSPSEYDLADLVGFRVYTFGRCHDRWVLRGLYGMHVHQNPSPLAHCGSKVWELGRRTHMEEEGDHSAPSEGCTCGFYGLHKPDPNPYERAGLAVGGRWPVWAYVRALGVTLFWSEGWKAEQVRIERLFLAPYLKDEGLRVFGGYETENAGEVLRGLANELKVPVEREPAWDWWLAHGGKREED